MYSLILPIVSWGASLEEPADFHLTMSSIVSLQSTEQNAPMCQANTSSCGVLKKMSITYFRQDRHEVAQDGSKFNVILCFEFLGSSCLLFKTTP